MQKMQAIQPERSDLVPWSPEHAKRWIEFNRRLDRDLNSLLNETLIENRLEELFRIQIVDERFFWLTLARLTELTLLAAGEYADGCEYQAAGDLLVNPREIEVYVQGRSVFVLKERHTPLREQFADRIGDENPVAWLKRNTSLNLRRSALLPYLQKSLRASGLFTSTYLEAIDLRMGRVAEAIAFCCSWQINDSIDLHQRLNEAGPEEKKFILSHLCGFDDGIFADLGEAILTMGMGAEKDYFF
jgi:hypothetical protein